MTSAPGASYIASTIAARCVSTARWFSDPLSVTSPRSIEGASASTTARATRVALPVPLAYKPSTTRWKKSRNAGAASTSAAGASAATPATARHASSRGKISTPTSPRLIPATTTSSTHGSPAAITRARSGPTDTKVPVESLKSSATRPSNANPSPGCAGSIGFTASPLA